MSENRDYIYKFSGNLGDFSELETKISEIKGISAVKIDVDAHEIYYSLDEWASEYDAFTAVMEAVESFGLELFFDEEVPVEKQELTAGKAEETPEAPEEDEKEEEKDGEKQSKYDFIEKIVVMGISAILLIVGLFLGKNKTAQMWVFMLSYTFAAYETLFDVITKAVEKRYLFDEILILLPTLAMLYLGKHVSACTIMLSFGLTTFIKKIAGDKIFSEISLLKAQDDISDREKAKLAFYEKIYSSTLTEEKFFEINKLKIQLVFVLFGVLVAFVPPLFKISNYGYLLINKWLYVGVSVMIFGGLSGFGQFVKAVYFYGAKMLYDNGITLKNSDAVRKIADAEEAVFDGSLEKNVYGAVKELGEDTEIKTTLLSSSDVDAVTALKKENGFTKAVASCSEKYKLNYLSKGSKIYFGDVEKNKNVIDSCGCAVSLGGFNENALASAYEKDLKFAPIILKVCARTLKTIAFNSLALWFTKITGVIAGSALFLLGTDLIALFFALFCAAEAVALVTARLNSRDTL